MESPCKKMCSLDTRHRFCTGCYRTIEEIRYWSSFTEEERGVIIAAAHNRSLRKE